MSDEHVDKIEAVLPGRWDVPALRAGASVCILFGVPFFVLASLIDSDSSLLNLGLFAIFLASFVVGSGCAAWVQRAGTPLSHSLITAVGSYAVIAAIVLVIRFVRGTDIGVPGLFTTLSFVSLAGLAGGFLGSRLQAQGIRPSSQR